MRGSKAQQGMSLIELIVAVAVLAIALTGVLSTYMMSVQANTYSHQRAVALDGLRRKSEEIKSRLELPGEDLDSVIDFYAANSTFTVPEADSTVEAFSGVGEIIIYLNEAVVPIELGADAATATKGVHGSYGPMSLDSNTAATSDYSTPVDGSYRVLMAPVEVRITWDTNQGPAVEREFILLSRLYD